MAIGTTAAAIIGAVSLAVGVAGTAVSIQQGQKAAKSRKKAEAEQRRAEENRVRRERRKAIREAQIKRAQLVNFAESSGTGGSSSPQGAEGSIESQLGFNIGTSTTASASNANIFAFNNQAMSHDLKAQKAGAIGQLGFKVSSMAFDAAGSAGGGGGGTGFGVGGGGGRPSGFNMNPGSFRPGGAFPTGGFSFG